MCYSGWLIHHQETLDHSHDIGGKNPADQIFLTKHLTLENVDMAQVLSIFLLLLLLLSLLLLLV